MLLDLSVRMDDVSVESSVVCSRDASVVSNSVEDDFSDDTTTVGDSVVEDEDDDCELLSVVFLIGVDGVIGTIVLLCSFDFDASLVLNVSDCSVDLSEAGSDVGSLELEGSLDGSSVEDNGTDGSLEGFDDGSDEGSDDGSDDGSDVGSEDGSDDGSEDGSVAGTMSDSFFSGSDDLSVDDAAEFTPAVDEEID